MIGAGMPRRDRMVLAIVFVVVLYAIAALVWFMGREAEWAKARKNYEKAQKQLASENRLISQRAAWRERAEKESLKMPVAEEGESTQTRWQRALDRIAGDFGIRFTNETPKPEEEHGGVWEIPIEVRFDTSLKLLVEFLYALNTTEGTMFDVRDLDVSSKNNGLLSVKLTVTCAYMKGD